MNELCFPFDKEAKSGSEGAQAETRKATALWWAADAGHADMVTFLLGKGASPELTDNKEGHYPLHRAALRGHLGVAQVLLADPMASGRAVAKVDVLEPGTRRTPLFLATQAGHAGVVRTLLAYGAALLLPDALGLTPLSAASHPEVIRSLLQNASAPATCQPTITLGVPAGQGGAAGGAKSIPEPTTSDAKPKPAATGGNNTGGQGPGTDSKSTAPVAKAPASKAKTAAPAPGGSKDGGTISKGGAAAVGAAPAQTNAANGKTSKNGGLGAGGEKGAVCVGGGGSSYGHCGGAGAAAGGAGAGGSSKEPVRVKPFLVLQGAMATLFERGLETARKELELNSKQVSVFPYGYLTYEEKVVVLARVAMALSGYCHCEPSAVAESCLYSVMLAIKESVENEANVSLGDLGKPGGTSTGAGTAGDNAKGGSDADKKGGPAEKAKKGTGGSNNNSAGGGNNSKLAAARDSRDKDKDKDKHGCSSCCSSACSSSWRRMVLHAHLDEAGPQGSVLVAMDPAQLDELPAPVWGTVVEMLTESLFGDKYPVKKAVFLEHQPFVQRFLYSTIGDWSTYFLGKPTNVSDAEVDDAERRIVALTPKGRKPMVGIFPPDHLASSMTMRQLVFSIEFGYGQTCTCNSCTRCRLQQERLANKLNVRKGYDPSIEALKSSTSFSSHTGGLSPYDALPKSGGGGGGAGGGVAGALARKRPGNTSGSGTGGQSGAAGGAAKTGKKAGSAGGAAVKGGGGKGGGGGAGGGVTFGSNSCFGRDDLLEKDLLQWLKKTDIEAWFASLTPAQRKERLQVPASDLDHSIAISPHWDLLSQVECEYEYADPSREDASSVVEYDCDADVFYPGPAIRRKSNCQDLLQALNLEKQAEFQEQYVRKLQESVGVALYARQNNNKSGKGGADTGGGPPGSAAGGDALLGRGAGAAEVAALLDEQLEAVEDMEEKILENHFRGLFGKKVLLSYLDEQREAQRQAALESLLRDEEERAAKEANAREAKKKKKQRRKERERELKGGGGGAGRC
eukprot:jgi/Mesvir1/24340/Mv11020-RA.1